MLNIIKRWYGRLWYFTFRVCYTFTHWVAYHALPDRKTGRSADDKPYILLVGVEFEDRHSTAKILHFVAQSKVDFPDKQVVLLSKFDDWKQKAEGWPVIVLPWEYQTRARLLTPLYKRFYKQPLFDEEVLRHHAQRAAFMVDLGDYQLDARRTTGWTANCLSNLVFAKSFGIPFYFFPQSVSPFFGILSPPWPLKAILNRMTRAIPRYAEAFCIREEWGMQAFAKRSKGNALRCLDYLMYSDPVAPEFQGWSGVPTTLVLVPDAALWKDEAQFLSLVTTLSTSNAARFSRFVVYAPEAASAAWVAEHVDWLPAPWTTELAADLQKPETFLGQRRDAVVVTAHYGVLIEGLLCGRPAVALGFDSPARSLYLEMGLESLLVDPHGLDPAAAVTKALGQLTARGSEMSTQSRIRRKELTLKHPLPSLVSP